MSHESAANLESPAIDSPSMHREEVVEPVPNKSSSCYGTTSWSSGTHGLDFRSMQQEPDGVDAINCVQERDSSIGTESSNANVKIEVHDENFSAEAREVVKTDLAKNADISSIRCRAAVNCKRRFESWNAMILHDKFYKLS